ncbi:MAG: lipoate--protein ligase family protein, partial [Pirellulales bacterium]|nr:lipoate--protein ligase family protein [Pirellulales bacterium]
MSIDQTLLETVDRGGPPTLRFYTWNQPTLSLGYFQPQVQRREHSASRKLELVRRATGGGAIVHHHELTYCLVMPLGDRRSGARVDLYQGLHQVASDVLAEFGVRASPHRLSGREENVDPSAFLCFQRRTAEDLVVAGYKVLGSAQRRGRR